MNLEKKRKSAIVIYEPRIPGMCLPKNDGICAKVVYYINATQFNLSSGSESYHPVNQRK